jgi:hypothetical protein
MKSPRRRLGTIVQSGRQFLGSRRFRRLFGWLSFAIIAGSFFLKSGCRCEVNSETSAEKVFSDKKVVALTLAAQAGDVAKIDALVGDGVDVNARGKCNNTPLLRTLYARNWEGYQALLRHNADPNILDDRGAAVTLLAAEDGDPKWLREALAHGGNPDLVDLGNPYAHDSTPLFYAVGFSPVTLSGRRENVRLLLAAGADPNYQHWDGKSAFYYAIEVTDYEDAAAMLDAGADIHLKAVDGLDAVEFLRRGLAKSGTYAIDDDHKKWLSELIERMNAKGAKLTARESLEPPGDGPGTDGNSGS